MAGMYGAPLTVDSFGVTKYLELDVPDSPPIEAYPPGEVDDPNDSNRQQHRCQLS